MTDLLVGQAGAADVQRLRAGRPRRPGTPGGGVHPLGQAAQARAAAGEHDPLRRAPSRRRRAVVVERAADLVDERRGR